MNNLLHCHDIVKTDFVRAENCSVYDSAGRRYVDFEAGIWAAGLGHGHPRVNAAIHAQVDRVIHLGTRYPNALAEQAAAEVLAITGIGAGKCTFLSSGSEAVEFGVQAARRITARPLMLTFTTSYLAAYGSAGRKSSAEWLVLDWATCTAGDLDAIPFDQLAGFAFEPGGSGIGFVRFPPAPLVEEIARRVKRTGGLLVANEITTGMGRTGKWFGFQHYDVQPDIVCAGKCLGGGYPVSVAALTRAAAEKLEESGFHYAQSHQNDPLGCAVACAVIAELRAGGWIDRGAAVGARFLAGLGALAQKHPGVKEARGRGMLLALEMNAAEHFNVTDAYHALLERGYLVGVYPAGNLLRFDPALTIDEEDITGLLVCLDEILESVT